MTLTAEQQEMRQQFENVGLYLKWTGDGRVTDVSPSDTLRIALLGWARTTALLDVVGGELKAQRERIKALEESLFDLKVYILAEDPGD